MPKFSVTMRAYDEVYCEVKVEVEADNEEEAQEIAIGKNIEGMYDANWSEAVYVIYDSDGVHIEEVEHIEPVTPPKRAWTPAVIQGGVV